MKDNGLKFTEGDVCTSLCYRFTVCCAVFKPSEVQFPECVSVHPVRVLFSWLLPVQIQGCVPFPSSTAPIVAQASSVSSSLVTFTQPMDVCFCVRAYTLCARACRRCEEEPGVKKLFKDFRLGVSTRESPCVPKHGLTPLRSETDKRGHEEIFPHDDVTAWGGGEQPRQTPAFVSSLADLFFPF